MRSELKHRSLTHPHRSPPTTPPTVKAAPMMVCGDTASGSEAHVPGERQRCVCVCVCVCYVCRTKKLRQCFRC